MSGKCDCGGNCITTGENLGEKIDALNPCDKCEDVQIKKFSPLRDLIDFDELTGDYMKCTCKKRPLDIVMSHILKIMIEEEIVPEKATLRRNSPVPLSEFYYGDLNPQFINEKSLILLHPDFTQKTALRLYEEVPEVKGVLKGNPQDTVGQLNRESEIKNYELLIGCDMQTNVMRTLIGEKIIINKNQSKHHIEVASTTEGKLVKLHNYLSNNEIKKGVAVDAMCGSGAIGICLLEYGFEKVIFNDIYPEAIENLKENLEVNGISEGYEIYNEAFEDLEVEKADICVIDAFPKDDAEEIIKKAEKIADNVLII
ncbi:50S ribosomal protein L11 methyltransferase [Methanobrevibacter millerae]|uniref:Ribosomal protein L11 methyltransferase (PrmA) n=1 Tax=Methanobrevibacter millerae TaxID=230361 RepID=A0A1G5WNN4_9EURY|nr:50S ribosomal protein L11 methyltransferase [Methanobrevibacter millerae]SDA59723.1 Ribosomal protein L11 methyltransferase (PrmA) [Methanobrevibacter millerae]